MLRFPVKVEPSDDVLFIHRPLPPENADLILYIEEQITELLFAEETLSDVIYRFAENDDELLIAVARKKNFETRPIPANCTCYRIPAAIDIWLKVKTVLPPDVPALVFATHVDHAYLLYADALRVRRVYQFDRSGDGASVERELLSAIERLKEKFPAGDVAWKLYSQEKYSDTFHHELRARSIEWVPTRLSPQPAVDKETLEQWDFRLASETGAQELNRRKLRMVQASLITAGIVAVLWTLLFGADRFLSAAEQRSAVKWQKLHSSLKEISYLQKQTRQCIAEIILCQKLSENRTNRALLLDRIAATRPGPVKLEGLRISEQKKRVDKKSAAVAPEEVVLLKGYSGDGNRITEWMELLLKSGCFSSVNLAAMEKKNNEYHFYIECGLPVR
jgi:Tfp pilus assembly protein PilN